MDQEIKGKIILITGGAGGIGYAVAENFLKHGAKLVILFDINEEKGIKAAEQLNSMYGENRAEYVLCDVTLHLEIIPKPTFYGHGYIDAVVFCAGIFDETNRRRMIEVNVGWTIDWTLKFWRYIRKDRHSTMKGGTLIIIGSTHGLRTDPYLPIYQAVNSALVGFTKSLGHIYNYDRTGVRVVCLCPGLTYTGMTADLKVMTPEPNNKLQSDFNTFLKNELWQEADTVGRAAVEVFQKADSGTIWTVEGGSSAKIVPS